MITGLIWMPHMILGEGDAVINY